MGPNPLFLRYIEQVLPSLGETGVSLSTVAGLVPRDPGAAGRRARRGQAQGRRAHGQGARAGPCAPASARCATSRGALRGRGAAAAGPTTSEEIVALARRRPGTHNVRRRFVEAAGDSGRSRGSTATAQDRAGYPPRREDEPTSAEEQADLARACAGPRRWPRRSTACGPACSPTSSSTICWAPGRCWPRPGQGVLSADEVAAPLSPPESARSTRCRGRWPTPPSSTRPAPCSGPGAAAPAGRGPAGPGRRGERGRRGFLAPGVGGLTMPTQAPSARTRGRDPLLRAHRGRRGPGSLADAAAHAGPALPVGIDDRGGRHRPGHRPVGAPELGRRHAAPEQPQRRPDWSSSP